ncbi:MAG TPA: alkaline phosphatase family protein, partial [Candidatus Dormibacteraeota bacterium]|nr:alkaline phosphatase family protein [Candidatus Dormibacteraeota bacterium]
MNHKRRPLVLAVILMCLSMSLVVADVPQLAKTAGVVTQAAPSSGLYFDHVVIVIMEDHGMQDICGRSPPPCLSTAGAPYLAGLANSYAIGSQYLGVTHYSQADYLAMLGGTTDGCSTAGCPYPFAGQNLVDRLESAGLTWKGYMENQNLASGCDMTYHQPYTPEHNPFAGFSDIVNSQTRCANIVLANPSGCSVTDCPLINDLNSGSAPNFMWLTPNNCDNMHGFTGGCAASVSFGDSYLSGLVPNILNSQTFTSQRSALFVVFDEGNGYCPLNQSTTEDCVYAVWAGRMAKQNFATSNMYNHYSWTKTIEVNWNLASITSNDANATPLTEFFQTPLSASFTYSPTSPQAGQQVTFTASANSGTAPYSFSWNFGDGSSGTGSSAVHTYLAGGTYTVVLTVKDSSSSQQTATSQQSITVANP